MDVSDHTILLFLGIADGNIEDQRLEQIHFGAVPEVVAPFRAGVFNNDIAKALCHQFIALDLRKAIPRV